MKRTAIKGIPVSPGIALGPGFIADAESLKIPMYRIAPERTDAELGRLERALETSRKQLLQLQREVDRKLGSRDAMIFAVHLQLLSDSNLKEKVASKVREDLINIEAAVKEVISWYAAQIDGLSDSMLSDKSADIRDVGNRVIRNLLAHDQNHLAERAGSFILLTHELLPSDTAHMDVSKLMAVITEVGGKASHAAILARSLSIPAVTGVQLKTLPPDIQEVLVDGREGIVILNPTSKDKEVYSAKKDVFLKFRERLLRHVHEASTTQDGTPIELLTNVENVEDINPVDYETLAGIGLYRTEYVFMNRNSFPSEEEQYQLYSAIVKRVGADKQITFRTIDIGGDKRLPYFTAPDEANPVLGWRGARIILEWPDIFFAQARALLRAAAHGQVNIMVPMVTSLEEVRIANRFFNEIRDDLRAHKIPFGENTSLGVMIEVPSAAWDIKSIAQETDFVSIGTNDLIQYLLAVDRNNARVASMYQPLHPAVLRAIHWVIRACVDEGRKVSICGEMAGNFNYTQLLLGMGLRRFSMAPFYVNGVKQVLRATTIAESERIAERALGMKTVEEIRGYLKSVNPLRLVKT